MKHTLIIVKRAPTVPKVALAATVVLQRRHRAPWAAETPSARSEVEES